MQAKGRTIWRCRRGMKELDVLLERFLARGYPELGAPERDCFERLLDQVDQDILRWLWGREAPVDPELAALVEKMRAVVDAGANR